MLMGDAGGGQLGAPLVVRRQQRGEPVGLLGLEAALVAGPGGQLGEQVAGLAWERGRADLADAAAAEGVEVAGEGALGPGVRGDHGVPALPQFLRSGERAQHRPGVTHQRPATVGVEGQHLGHEAGYRGVEGAGEAGLVRRCPGRSP